jgi:hypothetical protein
VLLVPALRLAEARELVEPLAAVDAEARSGT